MKLIYSHFKKLIPELNQSINRIGDDLTLIGHLAEEIEKKRGEEIINLEIAKNRGDCLGYYGLAKDLSVYYNLELKAPKLKQFDQPENELPNIKVSAKEKVFRLMAVEIENLTNKRSPNWLKEFLEIHHINTINTLVDLTNYIMLIYGIPCHAFDTKKISHQLEWKIADQKETITTLDGTEIIIEKGDFYISDPTGAASLPAIGGKRTAIDLETTEILIEMAIYDPLKVRLDAKKMNVRTEASIRLEKNLDTELISESFNRLIDLITDLCGGKIKTNIFDYYPQKPTPKIINYHPQKPTDFSGIKIPEKKGLDILRNIGCKIKQKTDQYEVIPPSLRRDLNLEEDLVEEVIRFYGYDKIPTDQPISSKKLPDITPKIIKLQQSVKNKLANLGYDEIRSWPIIKEKNLHQPKYLDADCQPVYTENNVNSNYPLLRMSLASSLYLQNIQAKKFKLPDRQYFEVGKIYYHQKNHYQEDYVVGIYHPEINKLKQDSEKLLLSLGAEKVDYSIEEIKNTKLIEINLTKLARKIKDTPLINLKKPEKQTGMSIELTKQIIDLDVNINLRKKIEPEALIKKYYEKIDSDHLWKLEIIDVYQTKSKKFKYTMRAYYYNLTAQKAKKLHSKIFKLKEK